MNQLNSSFKKAALFFLIIPFFCAFFNPVNGQALDSSDNKGIDFWLTFPGNYVGNVELSLFISGDENTSGTVSVPGLGFSTPFNVTAGNVTTVIVPQSAQANESNVIKNNGIHVTSVKEVTVYGLNRQQYTTDAFMGLPTDILGTSYINLGYYTNSFLSQFGIVATQNATNVTIIPTVTTNGHPAGVAYSILLNRGQTYLLGNDSRGSDLSGSIITSNKPIAVFGSHQCANIPPGAVACDYIVEQLPPTTAWGRNFVTVPLKTRLGGDTFRFLASTNGTVVRVNGAAVATLSRGEFFETILPAASQITSNLPILVAQYSNGSSFDGVTSDPFMMLIPPYEQFLGNYIITTPATGFSKNFVNVAAPTAAVGTIRFDGVIIPPGSFSPIGSSGFSGAQIDIDLGAHTLTSTNLPFGVFVYGFDEYDSYGYPGGQSVAPVANLKTLVLSPKSGTKGVGQEQCFTATAKDQFNNPVVGIRVDFMITGPNSGESGFGNTNLSGVATFCYTGLNKGTDNIKASVGTITDAGSFVWTPAGNTYYSKPAGNLHNVATWGVIKDGSGTNPTDFETGNTFILANRPGVYTLTGNWTVGGLLVIPSASQLQINGSTLSLAAKDGSGTITGSLTSNFIIAGSAGGNFGTLNFTPGGAMLKNFTLNRTGASGSASIGTALSVYNILNVMKGTLNTLNRLTLKSNANNTARVAPVTGNISGSVTVERFIPARRAWRLMNSPVNGSQTINAAWQEGATTASMNPNPTPGFGTHITKGTVANGFDQNPNFNHTSSIKTYSNATDAWAPLMNTNSTTVGNKPLMLFVRGDRGIMLNGTGVRPTNTVLRATGPLRTGNQMFNVNATGFTAIPNPFASPINYATLSRTSVQNNFYLWDPKMGGTYGVGAFVNVSFNGTTYDVTPASVSPESQYIQSGQSFLVRSTGVAGTLVIKESDKSATASTDVFVANPDNQPADKSQGLRVNLQVINADNTESLVDEVYSSYGRGFSDKVDDMDAEKMPNIEENLAIVRGDQSLMVERRSQVRDGDIIHLNTWNTGNKSYFLEFNPINMSATGLFASLVDKYLNTSTPISLKENSRVYFSVNSDASSANASRFTVTFSKNAQELIRNNGKTMITVYPNPINGSTINLQFVNGTKGKYQAELVNSLGQVIFRKDIQLAGGSTVQNIQLDKKLSKGVYQLQLRGGDVKTALQIFCK